MKLLKEILKLILVFTMLVGLALIGFICFGLVANAEEYTNAVIEDLQQDPTFYTEDYPDKKDDYSLYVIQIGETLNKELIIYVYQPAHKTIDLLGTKISISYGFSKDGKGLEPKLYPLELLSTSGVFDKYVVKNFEIPNDTHRYYNIISIFREFNSSVDTQSENYGDFTDISIAVGQQWYAYDINNSIAYEMNTFNTMVINTDIVEKIDFEHGLTWGNFVGSVEKGNCWFIAFNCEDYVIKHIYDADLSYTQQKVEMSYSLGPGEKYTYSDKEPKNITLKDNDIMSYTGEGLWAGTFEWNRILSSKDFIKKVGENSISFDDDVKKKIENSQWVFTFAETEWVSQHFQTSNSYYESYYHISEVGILRLHFLDTTGKTYDLGVVNSLFEPDDVPGGYGNKFFEMLLGSFKDFFEKTFAILGLIVLVIVLVFLSNLFTPIWNILKTIFKAVFYVISLPFKIIKWVFKRK
ncbi:MAG: hypothetical protein NC087_01635 [Anaeroplasma bactoclasticum]|nr:hypothetical protein [Anaeroplasma bactoclasticum]